jgi:prophage regulatory protein
VIYRTLLHVESTLKHSAGDRTRTGKGQTLTIKPHRPIGTMKPIYLDLPSVAEALSLSTATVKRLVAAGDLPKPRALTGKRVAWLVRELEEWADARPVADMLPPPNTGGGK